MDQNRRAFTAQMIGAAVASIGTVATAEHQHEALISADGWKQDDLFQRHEIMQC